MASGQKGEILPIGRDTTGSKLDRPGTRPYELNDPPLPWNGARGISVAHPLRHRVRRGGDHAALLHVDRLRAVGPGGGMLLLLIATSSTRTLNPRLRSELNGTRIL